MAKRPMRVFAVLLLGLTVAACGGQSSTGGSSVELTDAEASAYAEAQAEPPLAWYSSQDPERNEGVLEAFRSKYPDLQVNSFRLASGQLATRYSQERQSGLVNAGLVTVAAPEFVQLGLESDWFQTFEKPEFPELANLPDQFFNQGIATTGISVFGIGYNADVVETPPATWQDMLDPRYQGQITFGDPRNVPSYMALARVWLDEYGPEFLRQLAAQQPTVVGSMVPGTQQLAAGEAAIALPSVLTVLQPLTEQGAPLEYVAPDVTTGNEFETMISTDSRSPGAARLLYQFLFTPEGQQAFNGNTSSSPLGGEGTVPLPKNYVAPRVTELTPAEQDNILSLLGLTG